MWRLTWPCSSLTPLAARDNFSASTVMQNGSFAFFGFTRPSAMTFGERHGQLRLETLQGVIHQVRLKRSWPASTGVWVVKMHSCFGQWPCASAKILPAAIFSRINSSVRNAAWPSFMWKTDGCTPSLRSSRTPPMPSRISCMMRVVLSPP